MGKGIGYQHMIREQARDQLQARRARRAAEREAGVPATARYADEEGATLAAARVPPCCNE